MARTKAMRRAQQGAPQSRSSMSGVTKSRSGKTSKRASANHASTNGILSNASCLRMALDIGTTSSSCAYQVVDAHGNASINDIKVAKLCTEDYESPMVVAYDDNGVFSEGYELVSRLETGEIDETSVLRFAKLALQETDQVVPGSIHEKIIEHTRRVGKTPNELMTDYVKSVVRKARAAIARTLYGSLDHVRLELVISTPQIWHPQSNIALVEAGKQAGAASCVIVPEPLCAAASVLWEELKHDEDRDLQVQLRVGEMAIVADLGGGTGDTCLIRLCARNTEGSFQFEVVKPAQGNLAGAARINEEFVKWLENIYIPRHERETLADIARNLGYTPSEFRAKASAAFEKQKIEYPKAQYYNIIVNKRLGAPRNFFVVLVDKATMPMFFAPVAIEIEALLRQTASGVVNLANPGKLKAIILCGGLGSSSYISERLKKSFPAVPVLQPRSEYRFPVCKGALIRYSTAIQKPLGSGWSLCCKRNEEYSPNLHPDATFRGKPRLEVVKNSAFDEHVNVVEDRCTYILDGARRIVRLVWSERCPEFVADDAPIVLEAEVYLTVQDDPVEHEPLCVDGTTELHPHFQKFATVKRIIHNPLDAGVRKKQHNSGEISWVLMTCVAMRLNQDNIELAILWRDSEEDFEDEFTMEEYIPPTLDSGENWQVIWNPQYSHISQEVAANAPLSSQSSSLPHKSQAVPTASSSSKAKHDYGTMPNEDEDDEFAAQQPILFHRRVRNYDTSSSSDNDESDSSAGTIYHDHSETIKRKAAKSARKVTKQMREYSIADDDRDDEDYKD